MITVLTGNFGSGKTEIAVNLALKSRSTLIDLDLVNPYFRSRKAQEELEKNGVKVVIPPPNLASSDLPIVTPEILGELQKENTNVVVDVGGDNVGAVVLGRFSKILADKGADILLVINPYRPFTGDFNGVKQMLQEIEVASRLNVVGIISNPNLGRATTLEDVLEGHKKVKEISQKLDRSIHVLTCRQDLVAKVTDLVNVPVMGLNIFMVTPWEI